MSFCVLQNLSDHRIQWLTSEQGESDQVRRQKSRLFAMAIRPQLEASVIDNMLFLQRFKVPSLYQSGVKYREEPPTIVTTNDGRTMKIEEFAGVSIVLARGWGDCDDLAPWRCAELRLKGQKASIRVQWKQPTPDSQKVYHIVVRRPSNISDFDPRYMARAKNGNIIEDPSMALGMPSSIKSLRESAAFT